MRSLANISFRLSSQQVNSLLPRELDAISLAIEDRGNQTSFCTIKADQIFFDLVVEWGRQEMNGASLIRIASFDKSYERSDLDGYDTVEVYAGEGRPDESSEVQNYYDALTAYWQCEHCRRVTWKQHDNLEVEPIFDLDFQVIDDTYDWIVSNRAQSLMWQCGGAFRPLKNSNDYTHFLVGDTCSVRTDVPPVQLYEPCPVCHRYQGVNRNNIIEGDLVPLDGYMGITVRQELPLTIQWPAHNGSMLAKSAVEFGGYFRYPSEDPHILGSPIELQETTLTRMRPFYFADASLVRDLLDAGVTGLAFRPVNIENTEP